MMLKWKEVKIRKSRRCFTCQDRFQIGSKMTYSIGIWEGDFACAYYCPCCVEYIDKFTEHGDLWGEGDFRGEEGYEKFKKEYYEKRMEGV